MTFDRKFHYRSRMQIFFAALFFCLFFIIPQHASAAPCLPAEEGQKEWFSGDNKYRYCNGTDWIDYTLAGTGGACSTSAEWEWNDATNSFKACIGGSWQMYQAGGDGGDSSSYIFISASSIHTCGIRRDGTAWCWGAAQNGKLGDNQDQINKTAVQVKSDTGGVGWQDWISISTGEQHTCGIRKNGTAWCWGENGALGTGESSPPRLIPVQVKDEPGTGYWTDWKSISAGNQSTCGLRADKTLWCWGYNALGSVYTGDYLPNQVKDSAGSGSWNDWKSVSMGWEHACGIREDKSAWCWGTASYGRLGDGQNSTDHTYPVQVKDDAGTGNWTDWVMLSARQNSTCGLREDGTAWCWGQAHYGRLGNGETTPDRFLPVQVKDDAGTGTWSDWTSIATADYHTCGIRADKTAWCWGMSTGLGVGPTGHASLPKQVNTDTSAPGWNDWLAITVGTWYSCGTRMDGTAWCWGHAQGGKLGDGQEWVSKIRPQKIKTQVMSITTGADMSCSIRTDGTAWCWGYYGAGYLGDGQNTSNRTRPVQVKTDTGGVGWSDWIKISANGGGGCGLRSNGTAWCWGWHLYGGLGDGQDTTTRLVPVQVHNETGLPGWDDWIDIAKGSFHACGIRKNGSLWCWGWNSAGQLGNNVIGTNQTRPVRVKDDVGGNGWNDWISITAASQHTCGIRENGTAWCWGDSANGVLGDGQMATDRSLPVQVNTDTGLPGWDDWVSIDGGDLYTCGLRQDGSAWCWGDAFFGQLGDGQTTDQSRPVRVQTDVGPGGWNDWVYINAGTRASCGIRSNGTAWCWGQGSLGKLGDGQSTVNQPRPVQVQTSTGPGGWNDWLAISGGSDHTCGMRGDYSIWCWGLNSSGQIGDGTTITKSRPASTQANIANTTTIASNGAHNCSIRENGTLWCWGNPISGQLGDNQNTMLRARPIQVHSDTSDIGWRDWKSVAIGSAFTCGIRANGTLWCWGDSEFGALGDGQAVTDKFRPNQVKNNFGGAGWSDWVNVSSGGGHSCGVRQDGSAWCWGSGALGKLGNGDTADQYLPVQVQDATGPGYWTDWVTVKAGEFYSCGVRKNGTAWCWGGAQYGRLGDNQNTVDQTRPVQVVDTAGTGTWNDWVDIEVSGAHSCGIRANGRAYCWGRGSAGRLGNNSTADQVAPVEVHTNAASPGWDDWAKIVTSAGGHTCGLRHNGTAWCWGTQDSGRLGDGGTTSYMARPTQVKNDSITSSAGWNDWVSIEVGYWHTCGARSNGRLYCWGRVDYAQVGDGQNWENRTRPVSVHKEYRLLTEVSPGAEHTCSVRNDGTAWCWGNPQHGRLGDGQTTIQRNRPTRVIGKANWDSISAGSGHSCGIRQDGTAWCWGLNQGGQVGNGGTINQSIPVQVQSTTGPSGWNDWVMITAGGGHSCGIRKDGTAWCWGWATAGKLGDNQSAANRLRPVQVHSDTGPEGWNDWVHISANWDHTCGVRHNGTAWCWGNAATGRLGDGQTTTSRLRPTQVLNDSGGAGWDDWITVEADYQHSCGLRRNGTIWCWGQNGGSGILGNGGGADSSLPVQVQDSTGPGAWNDWVTMDTGIYHNCGTRASGRSYCWGNHGDGRLGDGQMALWKPRPVEINTDTGLPGWDDWYTVKAGGAGGCGVRADGRAWCWGSNTFSQVGDGTTTHRPRPVQVNRSIEQLSKMSVGANHVCSARDYGSGWCWGMGSQGRLGNNLTTNANKPVFVIGPGGSYQPNNLVAMSAGSYHSCGIAADGSAWCWGETLNGRVGDNQTTTDRLMPVIVHTDSGLPGWVDWKVISAGQEHTCGVRNDGSAWCWGRGLNYRLGNASTSDRTRPINVHTDTTSPGWTDWVTISAGTLHSCGIREDGTAWCWGAASEGRLGNNTTAPDAQRPVQVQTNTGPGGWNDWVTIKAGEFNTCGLRSNGTIWCWGRATTGSLGDGQTATAMLRPVQVKDDVGTGTWSDWVAVDVSGGDTNSGSLPHACGVRANGTMWCWGAAEYGKLGNGTTAPNVSLPVQVQDNVGPGFWTDWLGVSVSGRQSCGLRADGSMWCWGYNVNGAVGDGTNTDRSRPAQVIRNKPGVGRPVLSAGYDHSCGIRGGAIWCWGESNNGTLGDGQSTTDQLRPVATLGGFTDWATVIASRTHTCGVRTNGTGWCWGAAANGKLGDGQTITDQLQPVQVKDDVGTGNWTDWSQIVPGDNHTCGVRTNGTMWCWGDAASGKLGNSQSATSTSLPVQVHNDAGTGTWNDWVQVSTRGDTTCGIRSGGSMWCWGESNNFLLGNNQAVTDAERPVEPFHQSFGTPFRDWTHVSVGESHACAIRQEGMGYCWGLGTSGQMGDNNATNNQVPAYVFQAGIVDWVTITAAGTHTCGIRSDKSAWCWGNATNGALGDGQIATNRNNPVQVQNNTGPGFWTDWVSITAGSTHTCGTRTNGTTHCWGLSGVPGHLGNNVSGAATKSSRPVEVHQSASGPPGWNDWTQPDMALTWTDWLFKNSWYDHKLTWGFNDWLSFTGWKDWGAPGNWEDPIKGISSGPAPVGPCLPAAEGSIDYDAGTNRYIYCDGTNWYSMGE